jgi:hypothetical protein
VSVLLPVRNAAATLRACLDSLAGQTLADHEVVAVDDGSEDGSAEILLACARADPRLRVARIPRRGIVGALRVALDEARAPLVARMDADDVARSPRLALQVDRLERDPAVDVLGCRVALAPSPGCVAGEGMRAYVAWQNALVDHEAMARDRFVESPLVHPSVAMRTATLRRLGGWRDFDGPEDYDLWLRGLEAGLRFAKLTETLLEWRDSPGRLTRTDPRYAPARFLALKLEALARGALAGGRAAVVWGTGPIGTAWSRALRAAGHEVRAFVDVDPSRVGGHRHGAPVVAVAAAGRLRGPLHLAAVGQTGARERIRAEAARQGLVDGVDLVAVA